ncbi:hypothetical protein H8L32_17010 [Undibacterium sp. CY18W]|uniref:Uncharacterized protein n=1 Tax=Undibacterium hunanense TaxID=2762292 RepID=A0ABR6ZTL8_9BURK|nr:hypothetical protein [Undibacterium hunanense]MBC3919195.1 hypothetical protein [Undibacterium hunanense]
MSTQTYFGQPASYYAQPVMAGSASGVNAQNLIDAFSECSMEQCEKMATMLEQGRYENFGRMMAKVMQDWAQ